MQHIDDEVLEAYVMQTLPPSNVDVVEEHLFGCDACQERLGAVEDWVATITAALLQFREQQAPTQSACAAGG